MSASGKGGGKGGGQNRSAGGLKTGGAVQPMGGGFYQQPMQMYQPSNTSSIYNPGNRLFDRMTPGFQSDYRPGLDFYGPSQYNGRLLVNQPNPGYYQQFMAPGSNYAPPPEPVNPDPTPTPDPNQPGPDGRPPGWPSNQPWPPSPYGYGGGFFGIDWNQLAQQAYARQNEAAPPPSMNVIPTTSQSTGGYDGGGVAAYMEAMDQNARATNNSAAPILDQASGNTPQLSGYDQRIQTLMGRGMTETEARKNQNSAITQGADYDLSGFVDDDEWLKYQGRS